MLKRFMMSGAALILCAAGQAAALSGQAQVVDGDTLRIGAESVRLHGIDAPERRQTCTGAGGGTWPCGAWSSAELAGLVSAGPVTCRGSERDRYGRLIATCYRDGLDIGADMVRRGAALAYRRYAMDYVDLEQQAAAAARGVWSGRMEAPETFRHGARAEAAPTGCRIKGNISASGQIYHLPGQRDYARTKISVERGERWFCDEDEARAAGWRRARR